MTKYSFLSQVNITNVGLNQGGIYQCKAKCTNGTYKSIAMDDGFNVNSWLLFCVKKSHL